jgi:hypothetical protein
MVPPDRKRATGDSRGRGVATVTSARVQRISHAGAVSSFVLELRNPACRVNSEYTEEDANARRL